MSLGNQISYYRKKANMTQAQLAEALDVSSVGRLLEEFEISDWQLRSRLFDEKHMYTFVKSTAVAKGLEQTCQALPYAKKCHTRQKIVQY